MILVACRKAVLCANWSAIPHGGRIIYDITYTHKHTDQSSQTHMQLTLYRPTLTRQYRLSLYMPTINLCILFQEIQRPFY